MQLLGRGPVQLCIRAGGGGAVVGERASAAVQMRRGVQLASVRVSVVERSGEQGGCTAVQSLTCTPPQC